VSSADPKKATLHEVRSPKRQIAGDAAPTRHPIYRVAQDGMSRRQITAAEGISLGAAQYAIKRGREYADGSDEL
jgi:hypothetical protein